ncbi:sensor histidine kinase [Xylanibacillus composti]|uniref:histidine kinase n=1 Tax=Xylanibacillus composti TaxID=1572762 RepID=A0A8J4M3Z9_9BACL|nr:histidine kinase [Xylanibacillus composti]MDT9726170.1 sensor histidine kinase [Xylanibacillus composti]GIQ70595.1 sensor histidine kinase [Xylanibacillus composti]
MSKKRKPLFIPFSYKLFISYLFIMLVPVIVIGSYAYMTSVQSIEQHTRENLDAAVKQIKRNVEFRVNDAMRSSDEIYADQVLSRYLSGYFVDWDRYVVTTQYVLPRVELASNLPTQNVRLALYLDEANFSEYYYNETEEALRSGARQFGIFHTSRIRQEPWYRALDLTYNSTLWKQVGNDFQYHNISFLRPLIDYETFDSIGLIKVTVKLKDIFEDVEFNTLASGSQLFVVDPKQEVLFASSHNAMMYAGSLQVDASEYLAIEEEISNFPAKLVALIPVSSFKDNSRLVRNMTILICLVSLLVLLLFSMLISRYFSKRFHKLMASLKSFKEGELHKRIQYRGHDEFALISDAFNDMASTIEKLIDEVYISKLEKKETELQVLHGQMNPHFLYNTFSSISRMAKLGEIEKLHEIIRSMAKFYRLSLNKGEMVIPIEKEIQIIEAYLEIQNIKYGDRIRIEYDIDPDILHYETVKFILQPFVENALEHAWYDDEIAIKLTAAKGKERIVMAIADNGLGMREDTIQAIFKKTGEPLGYGIRNVDQRLKLHFGKDYGVRIESEVGAGTTVRIEFPVREFEEKKE